VDLYSTLSWTHF